MDLSKLLNGPGSGGVGTFAGMKTRDPFWPRHANREFEHHTSARRREGRSAPRNDTSSSDLMSSSQKLLGGLNDESLRQPQSSLPSKRPLLVSDSVAHKGHSRMQPEFAVPSRLPEARPPRPSSPFSQNIKAPRLEPRTSAARVPLRTEPDLDCKTHPAKGTNARHVEPPLVIPFGSEFPPAKMVPIEDSEWKSHLRAASSRVRDQAAGESILADNKFSLRAITTSPKEPTQDSDKHRLGRAFKARNYDLLADRDNRSATPPDFHARRCPADATPTKSSIFSRQASKYRETMNSTTSLSENHTRRRYDGDYVQYQGEAELPPVGPGIRSVDSSARHDIPISAPKYPERSTLASMVATGPSQPRHPSFMYRSREGPSEESPQTSPDSLGSPELSPGTSFSPSNSNLPAPGYHQVYRPNDMYSPPSTKISNRLPSSRVLSGKSTRGPRSGPREREESGNLTPIQRRTVFEMDPFLQYEGTWIREHDEDGREVLRAVLGTEIWICKACGKNVGGDNRHATTPAPWKAHRNGDGSRKNACKAIIFYKEKAFAEFKQPNSEYYDLFRDYDSWDDPNLEDCLWSGDWLSYVKEIAPNEDGTAKTHHPSPRKEPIWLKFSRLAAQLPPDPQLEKKDNGHVFWKDARYTVGDYTRSLRGFRAPENHAYSFVGGP